MILVQLMQEDYDSISELLAQEIRYFEKTGAPGNGQSQAARWRDISSRFNPIAASKPTVLWSPRCPTCEEEMCLGENIPDQAGKMTVIWFCDNCEAIMKLYIYPGKEE